MDYPLRCFQCSLGNMRDDECIIPIGELAENNEKCHKSATEFCKYCPMVFYNKEDRFAHVQIDHERYPCLECFRNGEERFLFEEEFGNHFLHQHPLCKVVQCNVCPSYFSSKGGCDQHVRLWHPNLKTKPRRCIHCNASIKPKHMERHNKARHKGWEYQCPLCLCVFRSSGERDVHKQKNCEI